MGDNFSMDQGWGGWFGDNSRALHLLCNFFLLSFHQVHLGLSGILKVGNPWSSPVVLNPWGLLCPQEMFASVCSQFWLSWLGLEGEAGDVAKSCMMHKTAPAQQRTLPSNMSVVFIFGWRSLGIIQHKRTKFEAQLYALCEYRLTDWPVLSSFASDFFFFPSSNLRSNEQISCI